VLQVGLLLLAVLGLGAAWRWTPLSDWLDVDRLAAAAEWIKRSPVTPALVLAAYVIAGLVAVPITLVIIATVTVFGPWAGAGYALLGAELSALAGFGVAQLLGRDAVNRIAGTRVNRVRRMLSDRGTLTVATLRVVPVAPFTVINVIAGVSGVSLRDFAIGSLIGLAPGVIAFAFLADRLVASLQQPGATSILTLIGTMAMVILGLVGLRHWIRRRRTQRRR
jgi:uncharacterized membrane protein YdjX (TVP38/TMEM64 family)